MRFPREMRPAVYGVADEDAGGEGPGYFGSSSELHKEGR